MYVLPIDSLAFEKQKYAQPTVKEQMPSMAGGFAIGAVGAAIYCEKKGVKGKKFLWSVLNSAAGIALAANILYLLTHLPKKIEQGESSKDSRKTPNIKSLNNSITNVSVQNSKEISFKSVFNFSHVRGESLKKRAEVSVNRYASSAAATAAALANTGFGDAAALTIITKNMCKKIFEIYDCTGGTITAVGAVLAGKNLGINLLTKGATIVPGAGNALNATITYTLHQLEGRALIELLENFADDIPDMSALDIITNINESVTAGIDGIQNEKVKKILKAALDFFL